MGQYADSLAAVGQEVDNLLTVAAANTDRDVQTIAALTDQNTALAQAKADLDTQVARVMLELDSANARIATLQAKYDALVKEYAAYKVKYPPTPTTPPAPHQFGMYIYGGLTAIKGIEQEYNRPVEVIHLFTNFKANAPSGWTGYEDRLQLSVDMLSGYTFDGIIAGNADAAIKAWATKLVAAKMGGILIRPGWEYNGNWFAWALSKTTPAKWKAAYRRLVTQMRSVPGANFKFLWSIAQDPGKSFSSIDFNSYPGDDVVDYWDVDTYAGWGGTDEATAHYNSKASRDAWFPAWLSAAAAHGKQVSVSEWGCWFKDDPVYIAEMTDRFRVWPLHHQIYFNVKGTDGIEHRLSVLTKARQAMYNAYKVAP